MRFCLKGQCNFCHEKVIILIKIPYVEDGNIFRKYLQFEEKSFVGRQNIMLCQEKIHVWKWECFRVPLTCFTEGIRWCQNQHWSCVVLPGMVGRLKTDLAVKLTSCKFVQRERERVVQCIICEIGVTGRFTVAPPTGKDTKWPTKTWKYFNVFSLKICFSLKTFFSKLS